MEKRFNKAGLLVLLAIIFCSLGFSQSVIDTSFLLTKGPVVPDSLMLQGNIYDPLFLIKGKVAGASISKNGGHPAVPHHMIIRGLSSVFFSNNPVYVIDNIIGADISLLPPEQIASMEILNNITSSARYGNLGGNGVVIVETKFAENKKPISLNYNSFISFDQVAHEFDVLSASQLRDYATSLQENEYDTVFYDGGANVNYQDEMFRNTITNSHYLSGSGSVKNTSYYGSFSYKYQPGLVENSSIKRIGGNLKLKQTFFDNKLIIQAGANFNQQKVKGIDEYDEVGILKQTYQMNPTDPVYNSDGSYSLIRRGLRYFNPVEAINEISRSVVKDQILANLNASYAITDELQISMNTGYRNQNAAYQTSIPAIEGLYFVSNKDLDYSEYNKRLNIEGFLSYSKTFNKAHNLNAELGYAFRNQRAEFLQGRGLKPYLYIVLRRTDFDTAIINNSINSFFANVDYNYKQRYYLGGALRYDALTPSIERKGTLVTAPQNLDGPNVLYPSFTLGWKLSNEAFLADASWLSNLMLSGGYGEAGKENNLYTLDNNTKIDFERAKEYNIMLDFGFLENRVFGNLTYYNRTSFNVFMLKRVPVPPNPYSFVHDNSGEITNKGFELNISGMVFNNPKFSYLTIFTFSKNINDVVIFNDNYPMDYNYLTGYNKNSYIQQIIEGEPLFTFYLPQFYGFIDNQMIFVREDGGLTSEVSMAQKNFQGQVLPSYEIGCGNNFTFCNNFNLSFSLRYVHGHSIYNDAQMDLEAINLPSLNALTAAADGEVFLPKICNYYLEGASYLRFDNIVFSYTINLSKNKPDYILELLIGANNLFTITDYKGIDPEISYQTRYPGLEQANIYPPVKSYFFGLNLSL